jgi:hypothetical protein
MSQERRYCGNYNCENYGKFWDIEHHSKCPFCPREVKTTTVSNNERIKNQCKLKKEKDVNFVISDWKDREGLVNGFTKVLKKYGLYVYNDIVMEDSDTDSFLISKNKLTRNQIKKICYEHWDLDKDGDPK